MSTPNPKADPHATQVVFFGPPNSGKSRLMSAIAHWASRNAEEPLVELTPILEPANPNAPGGSAWRRELIPHRLQVDLPGSSRTTGTMLFLDCDGQAAVNLLTNIDRLRRGKARTALADAIRQADALVLVIDATWTQREREDTFKSFSAFLDVLESTRIAERDVGGLPIFLTLTKCDVLYSPQGTPTEWIGHVLALQAEVQGEFQDWFETSASLQPDGHGFGTTMLRMAATSIELPAEVVEQNYADASGAFGVTALFDTLLQLGREHRDRRERSGKRLRWTAGLAVALFALVFVSMLALTATREPGEVETLSNRVKRLQQLEATRAERLSDANLVNYRRSLNQIRDAEVFRQLPPEQQQYIADRLQECVDYTEYRERFLPPQFSPADVRTNRDYARLSDELQSRLAPPPQYEAAWADTEAGQLRAKWQNDLNLLRSAEDQAHAWFRGQITRANELLLADVPSAQAPLSWHADVKRTLSAEMPCESAAAIPGSVALPMRRGEALTYRAALRFERTANAERDWIATSTKLADLRDLAEVVGMVPSGDGALFSFPMPSDPRENLWLGTRKWDELARRYPRAVSGAAQWSVPNIPGPLQDELGRRLRLARTGAVEQVKRLIRAERGTGSLSALADMERNGLLTRPDMKTWGQLLQAMARWIDPQSPEADPVSELVGFISKERFEWPISRIDVTLPNSLKVNTLKPTSSLQIQIGHGGKPQNFVFELDDSVHVEAETRTYRFNLKPASGPLVYQLGDPFDAEVLLADGDEKVLMKWDDGRLDQYRFDRLLRTPSLQGSGPNAFALPAHGVRVSVSPSSVSLRIPELLPDGQ